DARDRSARRRSVHPEDRLRLPQDVGNLPAGDRFGVWEVGLLQRQPSGEAFFVSVEVLERRLGIPPAVVAGARVEVDEPQPLDLRAERENLAGPLADDPLTFLFGLLAFG